MNNDQKRSYVYNSKNKKDEPRDMNISFIIYIVLSNERIVDSNIKVFKKNFVIFHNFDLSYEFTIENLHRGDNCLLFYTSFDCIRVRQLRIST